MAKGLIYIEDWGEMEAVWDERGLLSLSFIKICSAPQIPLLVKPEVFLIFCSLNEPDAFAYALLAELAAYFSRQKKGLSLPFVIPGQPFFYNRVWNLAAVCPYGQTISYAELADQASCSGGARAVGNAMRHNPLLIYVPCHRVVATGGVLGGFLGLKNQDALDLKKRLLLLEGVSFDGKGHVLRKDERLKKR